MTPDLIVSKMPDFLTNTRQTGENAWHRSVYLRVKLKMTEEVSQPPRGHTCTSHAGHTGHQSHRAGANDLWHILGDLPETLDMSRTSPASSPHRQGWLHTVLRVCQSLCFAYNWRALGGCTGDYAQILDKCSAWGAKYQTDQLERRSKHGHLSRYSVNFPRGSGRLFTLREWQRAAPGTRGQVARLSAEAR